MAVVSVATWIHDPFVGGVAHNAKGLCVPVKQVSKNDVHSLVPPNHMGPRNSLDVLSVRVDVLAKEISELSCLSLERADVIC